MIMNKFFLTKSQGNLKNVIIHLAMNRYYIFSLEKKIPLQDLKSDLWISLYQLLNIQPCCLVLAKSMHHEEN
jgi:hypothetical protein